MGNNIIKQNELTSECFIIQMWGIESCECLNTNECGGQEIRKKLLNNNENK